MKLFFKLIDNLFCCLFIIMITLFNFISFIAIGKFKCTHYLDVKNVAFTEHGPCDSSDKI